jgi:hypothetical protein
VSATYALSRAGAISLTASPDGLRLTSPYDAAFVAAFKAAIPSSGRRWDGQARQWLIDPAHGPALVREIQTFYGVTIDLPGGGVATPPPALTEIVQLAYLGACKDREDGSVSASGYLLGNRNAKAPDLVVPEAVLRAWFDGIGMADGVTSAAKPAPAGSLYAVLCVSQDADAATLKTAYRRMARQTHPDVNKEPDAAEAFRRVQSAYDVLSDARARRKYDAGLMLTARADTPVTPVYRPLHGVVLASGAYWAPLRCGLLLATGARRLGRLHVQTIHRWQDLTRGGRVLVSSWPPNAECWREDWVTP